MSQTNTSPPLPPTPTKAITEWDPIQMFSPQHHNHALIILNQPISQPKILKQLWDTAVYRIAADGGANRLEPVLKLPLFKDSPNLDAICGDLDSLRPTTKSHFQSLGTVILHDPDQYSTDFTKCVVHLRKNIFPPLLLHQKEEPDIIAISTLGGRVDQALSQLHHLLLFQEAADPGASSSRVYLLTPSALTFVLRKGTHRIRLRPEATPQTNQDRNQNETQTETETETKNESSAAIVTPKIGKSIGILPLLGETILTTKGLEWDVEDWKSRFGGVVSTSNYVREGVCVVETSEDVVFTVDFEGGGGGEGDEGDDGDA